MRTISSRRPGHALSLCLIGLALSVSLGEGCSGDWGFALGPLEAGAPDARYQGACSNWASQACTYAQLCFSRDYTWSSPDQCVARATLQCELAAIDPNVAFDEARVANCKFPNDCSPPPVCWPPGRAAAKASCLWSFDCASGICAGADTVYSVCGACVCGSGCPSGQVCEVGPDGGSCVTVTTQRAPGESCASSAECQSFACRPATNGASVCAPFAAIGEPCGGEFGVCDDRATRTYCDATGHCSPITPAGYGSACGLPADGGGTLAMCTGFASCSQGACVPPAGDGQPCNPSGGIQCAWPAQCIAHRCIFPTLADCLQ
jgi:hypothetical protein